MLIYTLIGAAVLLAILIVVIAMQPNSFRITRSATIAAPPAAVFPQVNTLAAWRGWSPWEGVDPTMERTYDGPPAGVDAQYHWVGNKNVGEGRMAIVESRPNELVRFRLDFLKPFKATNEAEFTFQPQGPNTVVSWTMSGPKSFMFKAFHMIMNMEKMVGGEFEKGLATLKSIVEKQRPLTFVKENMP